MDHPLHTITSNNTGSLIVEKMNKLLVDQIPLFDTNRSKIIYSIFTVNKI